MIMKAHLLKALFLLSILFTGIHSTKAQCTEEVYTPVFDEEQHPSYCDDTLLFITVRPPFGVQQNKLPDSLLVIVNDVEYVFQYESNTWLWMSFPITLDMPIHVSLVNYRKCAISDTTKRVFNSDVAINYYGIGFEDNNICKQKVAQIDYYLSNYFYLSVNGEVKIDSDLERGEYNSLVKNIDFKLNDEIIFKIDEGGSGCPTIYTDTFTINSFSSSNNPKMEFIGDQPSKVGKGQIVNLTVNLKDTISTDKFYWYSIYEGPSEEYQKEFIINNKQTVQAIIVPKCGLNDTATANFDVYTKNVEGIIYDDANGNCVQDAGEEPLPHLLFKVNNQAQYLSTDNIGYYFASLPIGTHSLQFFDRSDYLIDSVCNTKFTINSGASNVQKPIGLQLKKISNVGINGGCTRVRPGMLVTTNVNLYNVGAFDEDAVVKLLPDTLLTLRSTSPEYDYMLGDTLVWEMSLMKNEFKKIILNFEVRLDLSIVNRNVKIYANIYTPNDAVLDNNERFISARITNSFDPNDKYLLPGEVFDSLSQKLTYRVRFQNTGTDTAFNIVVRDTMPAGLDLSTFELGAASHPFDFFIEDQNVLYWKFMNIQLPDSIIDEAGSHGYFYFTIEPSKNLALYDTVFNEADIYFDFNPPVITNNSMARYGEKVAVHLEPSIKVERIHLYPNPVVQQIRLEGNSVGGYDIIDAKGRMVQSGVAADNVIKVDQLPSGIYFLQLHDADRSIQFLKQ